MLTKLFFSTLYLSAFTFGGGYVIVSLMKKKFVDEYKWIDSEEMMDLISIAQTAPGPIAVNGSIVIGYKLAGFVGSFVAVLATILPPFVILSVVSAFYSVLEKNAVFNSLLTGMQAAVGAIIAVTVYEMAKDVAKRKNLWYIAVMIISFIAVAFFHVNVVWVVIVCALIGVIYTVVLTKKGGKK